MKFGLGHWVLRNHTFLFNEIPRNVIKCQCKTGLYTYIVFAKAFVYVTVFIFSLFGKRYRHLFYECGNGSDTPVPLGVEAAELRIYYFLLWAALASMPLGVDDLWRRFWGASGQPIWAPLGDLWRRFWGASERPIWTLLGHLLTNLSKGRF